ncbi:thioesterase -like protein [Oryza sativa Japonica Group]|nr:thioesterase -like protein [Oryza sativa Japonica Group]BAF06920.1 Os01g0882100 [Oryza sativa Japonica Group]|eukprot:NP_001045006.1 Os01g0882100 [Oryza sativa Japonica Group]
MHGGAVASLVDLVGSAVFFAGGSPKTGVTVEITVSYLDAARANEEIEMEARVLGIGETTGCVTVEVRRKGAGEVLAHGRITKYLAVSSKL